MKRYKITVYGNPAPQGSKRFVGVHGGKGIMIESSKNVAIWRECVKFGALSAKSGMEMLDGPLGMKVIFTVQAPKNMPKNRNNYPCVRPDLSKLVRSTEDALTDSGIWADDARVVKCSSEKYYPNTFDGSLDHPGAVIWLWKMQ